MGIFTLYDGFGRVGHFDVRFQLAVLQVAAVGQAVTHHGDAEYERWVLQTLPGYACHGSRNGHTHQFADIPVAVHPRCAVCIGIVGFAGHHNGRLVPAAAGHVAGFAAANHLREVFLAAEQNFDVLVQASAAIEAGVDDDALAVVVFAQNVRVDGTETVIAH